MVFKANSKQKLYFPLLGHRIWHIWQVQNYEKSTISAGFELTNTNDHAFVPHVVCQLGWETAPSGFGHFA